ncbi:MAG: cytochrome c biogenesis CcdA family protein [Candidatus Zhuqueibacterota bacterium]
MKTCVISITLLLALFLCVDSSAQELVFFHEKGCPECAHIEQFLKERIVPFYPIQITRLEIHQGANAEKMMQLARVYRSDAILEKGTPAIFIGESAFQGCNRTVQRNIEQAVRTAISSQAVSPLTLLRPDEKKNLSLRITLPALVSAAAVDAINPCAFAVLVLLLGTILLATHRNRKAILGAGFAFTAACYISYYLMGVGLFSAVQITGFQHAVYVIVSVLALVIGIWNIKDYFWPGRWFSIEVPKSWQPTLKKITSNITSAPGAFGAGIVISLFLLPCTSGPYVVIIGMLSSMATRTQALALLALYNVIFVLPFVLITLGIGFGFTTTARVEMWRQSSLQKLHVITGIIMVALGISMLALAVAGVI